MYLVGVFDYRQCTLYSHFVKAVHITEANLMRLPGFR